MTLTTSPVAINMHLMAGGSRPCWFAESIIVARLKAHSEDEVTKKLDDMVKSGDIMRAKDEKNQTIYSLTTNPILASN